MKTTEFFGFIGILALLVLLMQGVSVASLVTVMIVTALAAIPWYFGTRNRSVEATGTERTLATTWVWFRRVIGVGAGSLFLWAGWSIAQSPAGRGAIDHRLAGALMAVIGLFSIYVGIVGQGRNRAEWRDDIALHRANKRRYRWWI